MANSFAERLRGYKQLAAFIRRRGSRKTVLEKEVARLAPRAKRGSSAAKGYQEENARLLNYCQNH